MRNLKVQSQRAFTILELLVIIATVALLACLVLPALAKSESRSHSTIDLNNTRQILRAVHQYAADNSDFNPHPSWGTAMDCWLHSRNIRDGVIPGGASATQLAATISNQLTYFRKGQLAPFVANDQTLFDCPTDVAMRRKGDFKTRYYQRAIKLTSYSFTGAVSGFGAPKQAPNATTGGTFKLSDFRPTAFLLWEPDEFSSFNFNDAATNQENPTEGVSYRHTPNPGARTAIASPTGLALLGRFGGDASFIKIRTFSTLRNTPPENDLRCGPGYR
jgi:type II secretory pathway pseudopilin PulG